MSEPIISVSGLRGIVGESLTPLVAVRYVAAFHAGLPPGPIVLTRDGRGTGRWLIDVIRGTLCALGRNVIDADIAATPTTGVLVRQYRAAGGLQISASHNPAPYNGIKLFGSDGQVICESAGRDVLARYQSGRVGWSPYDRIGRCQTLSDTTQRHCRLVLQTVQVARIREKGLHVLLDSNHGAGSLLGRRLLDELGCHVTLVGEQPDGEFEHPPEPLAENLKNVCRQVAAARADVGFCQDPDADRLAIIDETGTCIGEEYTLAICLDHVLSERKGPVVTNCSTSRMAEDLARKYGVPFYRSKVGEANVVELMRARQAVFGGEGNGGPIDPRVGYVRDSFVAMAQVLSAMATRDEKPSQLVAALPRYAIHKSKVHLEAEQLEPALRRVESLFADAQFDRIDGLRLDWPDKWLLVRGSNTEPIVRVIAEAKSRAEAVRLCEQAAQALSG